MWEQRPLRVVSPPPLEREGMDDGEKSLKGLAS
jgi:hypothetical protein